MPICFINLPYVAVSTDVWYLKKFNWSFIKQVKDSSTTSPCHHIRYYVCINKTWNLHWLPFLFWSITRDIILTKVLKLSSIFFQYLITGIAWHPHINFYSCLFVIMYVAIYMLNVFQTTLPWCWSECCHCDSCTHDIKSAKSHCPL